MGIDLSAPWPKSVCEQALALTGAAVCGLAFAAAIYSPTLLFFALPLLFGVPHVAADVRHLVTRRDLPAPWRRTVWIGCAALLGLRAADALHAVSSTAELETLLAVAWALLAVRAAGARQPGVARSRLAICMVLGAGLAAVHYPRAARLVLLHAHNFVALLAAGMLFRARSRAHLLAGAGIIAGASVLASGVFFRTSLAAASSLRALPTQLLDMAEQIAPGLRSDYAVGVTSAFLFLQAVHYVIWLGVIPAREGTAGGGPSAAQLPASAGGWPLRALRALRSDFGHSGLAAIALASLAPLAGAVFQLRQARTLYLSLATFHVYLELVMLLYFWVAREPPLRARAGEPSCCS